MQFLRSSAFWFGLHLSFQQQSHCLCCVRQVWKDVAGVELVQFLRRIAARTYRHWRFNEMKSPLMI